VLAQRERRAVLQYAGRRVVGRRDPDLADDREPGLDHRSASPQSFDAGGRVAEKLLTREVNAHCHQVRSVAVSTVFDYGEAFKLRLTSRKGRRLLFSRSRRVPGGVRPATWTVAAALPVRRLPNFAIPIAPRTRPGWRVSPAISGPDHACNSARAHRASSVQPASSPKRWLLLSTALAPRAQKGRAISRAVEASEFSHRPQITNAERRYGPSSHIVSRGSEGQRNRNIIRNWRQSCSYSTLSLFCRLPRLGIPATCLPEVTVREDGLV